MLSYADTKILVINPIHTLREDICDQLQRDGFSNITDVSDGLEAIELLGVGDGVIEGVGVGLGSTDVSRITTLILVVGDILSRVKVNVSLPSVILSSTAVIRRAP